MKELPIVFTAESIRAILNGQKTMTRRIINPQPEWKEAEPGKIVSAGWEWITKTTQLKHWSDTQAFAKELAAHSRYSPGDHLWVKEVWAQAFMPFTGGTGYASGAIYKADYGYRRDLPAEYDTNWKTPRFMPKKCARIWLEVTNIQAEQLHDITEGDIIKEGCPNEYALGRSWFIPHWNEINAKRKGGMPWIENPWVEVKEFKLLEAK